MDTFHSSQASHPLTDPALGPWALLRTLTWLGGRADAELVALWLELAPACSDAAAHLESAGLLSRDAAGGWEVAECPPIPSPEALDLALAQALALGTALIAAGHPTPASQLLDAGFAALRQEARVAQRFQRFHFLIALGDAGRIGGNLTAALARYQEALRLADALSPVPARASLLCSLAQVLQGLEDLETAATMAMEARDAALADGETGEVCRALLTEARIRLHQGRLDLAQPLATRAHSVAREADDRPRIADALALLGHVYVAGKPRRLEAGIEALHESIALLSAHNDQAGVLLSYMLLGDAQLQRGDYVAAARVFAIARWLCQERGNPTEEAVALVNLAIAATALGHMGEALEAAEEARAVAERLEQPYQRALSLGISGLVFAHAGRWDEAGQALAEARAMARELEIPYLSGQTARWAQEAYLALGELALAEECGQAACALAAASGSEEGLARADALFALTQARLGRPAFGREAAARARASGERDRAGGDQLAAMMAQAWIEAAEGAESAALQQAGHALSMAHAIGAVREIAEIEGLRGSLLLAGAPAEALACFERMEKLAVSCEHPLLAAIAAAGRAAAAPRDAQAAARAEERAKQAFAGLEAATRDRLIRAHSPTSRFLADVQGL